MPKTKTKSKTKPHHKAEEPDWSARYSTDWRYGKIQAKIHAKTKHRCCWCHVARSAECHHAEYFNPLVGKVKNDELKSAGVSIFPVCDRCHKVLHRKENWRYCKADVVFGSTNTRAVLRSLRIGYKLLSG